MIARFLRKLSLLFGRRRFQNDLDAEMAFHQGEAAKELIAEGMTEEAAHYAAMRRFGNATRMREQSHEVVGFRFEAVWQDVRFGLRQLRKSPGFAATAILILALGIASSVAIFAFVDAALIQPLPYKDSSRLAVLYESTPLGPKFHLSYPDYLDWKRENKVFSSLDIYAPYGFMLQTATGLQQADGAQVSAGFFRTLGVSPLLGRDFFTNEDDLKHPRSVLLSYGAWQRRYGGRPDVLGQIVNLNGNPNTIIGVLPKEFSFAPAEPADFWAIQKQTDNCGMSRSCHSLFGIARLKDGVSFATAFADIKSIAQQLEREYPNDNRDQAAFMLPLVEVIVGDIRPILLVMLCGAAMLLLIASLNVASLLLARSEGRKREIAVRGAIGASPRRLVGQFITEGLLLALIGGAIGLAGAQGAMQLLSALIPKHMLASMPYLQGLGLNERVATFAGILVVLASALFALTPISRMKFAEIREELSAGGRGFASVVWRRFGSNLVVIELATAVVLLVAAGLLGKSFYRLLHSDIGMKADHIATVRVGLESQRYQKSEQIVELENEIVRRLQGLPGVSAVGLTSRLPLTDGDGTRDVHIVGQPDTGVHKEVAFRIVSTGYFQALKTRIREGRYFNEGEDGTKPLVAIANQAFVNQYFHGENPVGTQITFASEKSKFLIAGVIDDIQEGQLDAAPRAALYLPFNQNPSHGFSIVLRSTQDEWALLTPMVNTLHEIDPAMAAYGPETMMQRIHDAPATYLHRSSAWLVGGFATMALVLSVVGLYGVIAYSVTQRTREIGVRMALGAQRSTVYRMVLRQAGRLTAVGLSIGLVSAIGASLLIRKLLFGVEAWDAPTLASVAVVLGLASMIASFLPARRAASVNPTEALRAE